MPVSKRRFSDKQAARTAVWDRLRAERLAAFPFPPHGRIPNFKGAKDAAARLFTHRIWQRVKRVKVNPDAPQRYVREAALRRGIEVLVPTPRLRGGFKRLDPKRIPAAKISEAVSLSRGGRWAEDVPLDRLPRIDAIVAGSVAVTRDGRRCGTGEGYSDLEFAILRELGQPPVPVMTTVHDIQVLESFPRAATDIPVAIIATPTELIRVRRPPRPPRGIDWGRLTDRDYEEMPVLAELRALRRRRGR
jgi:5-formyltetrahydrofolate cyclo-ligase